MAEPAVHRTILAVDIAGFGDRRRTNLHQVAARNGMYQVLMRATLDSGVPWDECYHEVRGDGMLVVIPPSVAKSVLAEALPAQLGLALRSHNQRRPAEEQIRLRLALHAGEIHYDDHGVVGWPVNHAFRLLDAPALKEALAESTAALGIITSAWFYEEVVWHSSNREGYHQVRVAVKETDTTAWIWLPGVTTRLRAVDAWAAAPPASNPMHPAPQQLPAGIRQFVGRREELATLSALLRPADQDTGTVIITAIDGTAGIGKTTLALYWAHQAKQRFPGGQLHVNLRGFDPQEPMDPGQALHGFLDALGVPPTRIPADLDARAALYRTLVAGRRLLIVLDNARSTEQVRPLLPGASTCLVIITSRNRLDGLMVREGASCIALDLLSTVDALELLAERVNSNRVDAEPAAAEELVKLCARLPLALSIVAARAAGQPALPLTELVRELRDERGRLDALDLGHTDLDIRTVFSWSYATLPQAAARLFRLLGLHPGPDLTRHACAALTGDPTVQITAPLKELTAAHLLEEHVPGRYRFHDLLRAYAAERAEQDEPHRREAIERMLDYYLEVALVADVHIQRCRDGEVRTLPPASAVTPPIATYTDAMAWFSAENATLLSLITFAGRHGFDEWARRLAWACTTFLRRTGQRHERVAVHQIALAAARRSGTPAAQMTALAELSRAIARLGEHKNAITLLDEALAILADEGGPDKIGIHLSYADALEAHERYAEALGHAEDAWRIARRTNNPLNEAHALNCMARKLASLGRHTEALAKCECALALHIGLEHVEGEAAALSILGDVRHALGDHAGAIAHYERSLALDRELGDQYWEAFVLDHLGDACQAIGDTAKARSSWAQALQILETLRIDEAAQVRSKLARHH